MNGSTIQRFLVEFSTGLFHRSCILHEATPALQQA
jgi:hypothetical protein